MTHYREATPHEILMAQTKQLTVYVLEDLPPPQVGDIRLCEYAGHVLENYPVKIVAGPDTNGDYEVVDADDADDAEAVHETVPEWALTNAAD